MACGGVRDSREQFSSRTRPALSDQLVLGFNEDVGVHGLISIGKHRDNDLEHPVPPTRPLDHLANSPIILSATYQADFETVTIYEQEVRHAQTLLRCVVFRYSRSRG